MAVNLVNLENVTVAHGTRLLLDGVSLGVSEGDRIGVVGRNGGGKTTLLKTLVKAEPPHSGRVTHTSGLRTGVLTQDVRVDTGLTAHQAILGETAEHTWAGDARVREVLDGLGLHGIGLDSLIGTMSGGERRRVALASLLVQEWDLLVLDEPTNHLDVEGVAWLAAHLRQRSSAQAHLVVTHDRWFLDEVNSTTWEVHDGVVDAYEGGYSAYVLARAERDRMASTAEQKRLQLVKKELAWLRRGPPARTSKPQFRIDAANALIADEPPARDDISLQRFSAARLGKTVYELHGVTLGFGKKVLLDGVDWNIGPGDRVGIVGVNGAGKSTLLRLLVGEQSPDSGRVVVGQTVKPAYLSQEVAELDPSLRVLEAVEQVAKVVDLGGGKTIGASSLADRFGFTGGPSSGAQWTRVGDLSGGERRRLQILRLLMGEPNVILLDEPTNDLDIDTLTALEDLLDGWPGTLVVVSHDRYFLERVTTTTASLMGDGTVAALPGGVDEYLAKRVRQAPAAAPKSKGGGDSRAAKKELSRVEREIARLDRKEAELHAALAAQAADFAVVAALDDELRALQTDKAALEDTWLELYEAAEG
ncbi:MAG: Bis-ABC ATPase Uup [uncultured Frankineae bacterium]|uniref:Bis-ABC ATPase Uup n=1 Tax=uncultured Frankineae bacterium TaxID=437475 RepID=A0A6J4LL67_9ACTN|nr:MAG: Bis-ABC ATPase Uup [uncultured Frankineae bacterium]